MGMVRRPVSGGGLVVGVVRSTGLVAELGGADVLLVVVVEAATGIKETSGASVGG